VVELLFKGKRVASHRRSHLKGRHTTVTAHMPKAHQQYAEWPPQRLIQWAATSGVATSRVVETIWLFAMIWAAPKCCHNQLISVFSGCVHFAAQRTAVESA
jgi:hypothetical protein